MKGEARERVLSLHITTRGFCFCLFNGPGQLYDWGIKHVRSGNKNVQTLAAIEQLLIRYDPHAIVLEDVQEAGSRRVARVRKLMREIEQLADRAKADVYAYPWHIVFSVFKEYEPKTRHDLAIVIADMLPAIKRRLPPKRKIWLPQDPRQALFDATALGLTHYAVYSE
jgi:hypothetical protein